MKKRNYRIRKKTKIFFFFHLRETIHALEIGMHNKFMNFVTNIQKMQLHKNYKKIKLPEIQAMLNNFTNKIM